MQVLNGNEIAGGRKSLELLQWRLVAAVLRRENPSHYMQWRESVERRMSELCQLA